MRSVPAPALTNLTAPNSVTRIGDLAFEGCASIAEKHLFREANRKRLGYRQTESVPCDSDLLRNLCVRLWVIVFVKLQQVRRVAGMWKKNGKCAFQPIKTALKR